MTKPRTTPSYAPALITAGAFLGLAIACFICAFVAQDYVPHNVPRPTPTITFGAPAPTPTPTAVALPEHAGLYDCVRMYEGRGVDPLAVCTEIQGRLTVQAYDAIYLPQLVTQ